MSEWRGIVLNSQVIAQVMLDKMLFWHKVTFLQRYLQRHMWSSFICICGEKKQFIYIEWRSHLPTFKNYLGNALFYSLILWFKFISLTLERLGGQSLWFFQKLIFWKEGEAKVFLWLIIIIRHIFTENFIELPQVVQKIWGFSPSILIIFIDFSDFLTFPFYKETNDVSI